MSSVAIARSVPRSPRRFLTEADLWWAFGEVDRAFGAVVGAEAMGACPRSLLIANDRSRVSRATAPLGGVAHSRSGHSGGPGGVGECLVTRYLTMPTGGGLR